MVVQGRRGKCTSEVLLEEILKTKEHNFLELGAFFPSALKVGVDLADVWWVLSVVCDLEHIEKRSSTTCQVELKMQLVF